MANGPHLAGLRGVATLGGHGLRHVGAVRAVGATASFYASVGDGTRLHLWSPSTGESVGSIEGTDRHPYSLCLSADGTRAFVGGGQVQILDLLSKRQTAVLPVSAPPVVALATAAELVLYGDEMRVRCFDIGAADRDRFTFNRHGGRINACALSEGGLLALTCGGDRVIRVFDLARSRKRARVVSELSGYARSCGFLGDGVRAWTVGWDHVRVFDIQSGETRWSLEGPRAKARVGALSPDGRLLAVAYEQEVLVFALPDTEAVHRLDASKAETLAFNHDGTRLLVANYGFGLGEGCAIEVFDLATERRVLPRDDGHRGQVVGMAAPPGSPRTLISVGVDASVRLWDLDSGTTFEQLGPLSAQARAVTASADGSKVITIAGDGRALVWEVGATRTRALPIASRDVSSIALSPDGRFAAWASKTAVTLLPLDTPDAPPVPLGDQTSDVSALVFAPDSTTLFTAGIDGRVNAWSLDDRTSRSIHLAPSSVKALAVVPGPPVRLLMGCADGRLQVFQVGTRESSRIVRVFSDLEGRSVQALAAIGATRALVLRGSPLGSSKVEILNLETSVQEAVADFTNATDQASCIAATSNGEACVGTNAGQILLFEILATHRPVRDQGARGNDPQSHR